MNSSILLAAAAAAAIAAAGCNRPEVGTEKEKNESAETRNSASADDGRGRDERAVEESERAPEDRAADDESASGDGGGEEFGSRLRGAGSRGTGDGDAAELREALQLAAREQRARLPLRDGVTTVYDVSAEGTEFIVSLRIAQDFSDAQFERLGEAFRRNSCEGDSANLIRLGATTTYRVTDSEGERRSFSFDRC